MFSVGRMQIRHFRRFRQSGPFLAGDKSTVYQDTVLGDRLLSSAGTGKNGTLSMRVPPSPVLDKNRAPMDPEILSSTGLGSGERLLRGFQTPILYWINFNL